MDDALPVLVALGALTRQHFDMLRAGIYDLHLKDWRRRQDLHDQAANVGTFELPEASI